nr:hypothetical protein [Kineosporia babensis]
MPAQTLLEALAVRDLTDPDQGPHALQLLLDDVLNALITAWNCDLDLRRRHPLVAVEDNYDRLGYSPDDITRDARYSRYVGETVMLRSHTSAGVPPTLRSLENPVDVLLVLPGMVYRRDSIDRTHVGTPHQVDLWRVTSNRHTGERDLQQMIALLVDAVLPGADWRALPASHPYTQNGLQIDVRTAAGWMEVAECGLIAGHVLSGAGHDPAEVSGLALGLGLDRALMLRKGLDDIRLLRSENPKIAAQMLDLSPWRPVSVHPVIRRDLSIVTDGDVDAELLGDSVRSALGAASADLESVSVIASTPHEALPRAVQERLGTQPGQVNVLLRLELRPLNKTLTDAGANALRDRVYAAVHRGPVLEWAARTGPDRPHSAGQGGRGGRVPRSACP